MYRDETLLILLHHVYCFVAKLMKLQRSPFLDHLVKINGTNVQGRNVTQPAMPRALLCCNSDETQRAPFLDQLVKNEGINVQETLLSLPCHVYCFVVTLMKLQRAPLLDQLVKNEGTNVQGRNVIYPVPPRALASQSREGNSSSRLPPFSSSVWNQVSSFHRVPTPPPSSLHEGRQVEII